MTSPKGLPSLYRLSMSILLILFCFLHKYITVIVIKNVLGLPDYVIGELLTNSNVVRGGERLLINSDTVSESTKNLNMNSDYIGDDDDDKYNDQSRLIRFIPRQLNFKQHYVGIPYIERVTVENLQPGSYIQMISISGNTVHFHCSFFEDTIIHPRGNTSFEVVFLARQEGPVSNTLFIHTSIGSFKYQVSAIGAPNPYRLRPFVGAKVPINSSYSPVINIYNPYSSTIQLTEMYTTGGGLHLELPNGEDEGPQELWQIAPFETKPIMVASFLARSEKNHTAFIRIKTNVSDEEVKELILPVEVEVSSTPGIYSPVDILDFGVVRSIDGPITLPLQILNAGSKSITIQNVIATPVNEALDIDFSSNQAVRIPPNIYSPVEVARLNLSPGRISSCWKQCSGKIVVKSKNNQYKLSIPYQVTLLTGHLGYNESQTQFYILSIAESSELEKRRIDITNHFNSTILIHSVSLRDEAKPYFNVVLVGSDFHLKPYETRSILMITFTPSVQLTQLQTHFRLHTNISFFDIPLNAYSGRLEVFIPQSLNQTILDFGTFGLREKKSMIFAVINNNPVDVHLKSWGCNMSKASVELIGIAEGNVTIIAHKSDYLNVHKKDNLYLKPRHYALFQLDLAGFDEEGYFFGQNHVITNFETLRIPFQWRVIEGSLSVDPIIVTDSFPGGVSSQDVEITSSFSSPLTLKSVNIIPDSETRFRFEPISNEKTKISFGKNVIGKLYFDPSRKCAALKTCYSGLDTTKEVGHLWLLSLTLSPESCCIDRDLFSSYYSRWANMNDSEKTVKASLNIEVESGVRLSLAAQANLKWPKLVHGGKSHIRFPLTRIGNTTIKEVILENPSNQPILIQAILLSDFPEADTILHSLQTLNLWADHEILLSETRPKSFKLLPTSGQVLSPTAPDINNSDKPSSAFPQTMNTATLSSSSTPEPTSNTQPNAKNILLIMPPSNSLTMILPGRHRRKISIGFTPQYDPATFEIPTSSKDFDPLTSISSTFLLIRNNLTILDAIHLSGEGGSGLLKLGSQLPGSKSVISFDLQEKHLFKSCKQANNQGSSVEPSFTVQKSFNLVNLGKLPIRVRGYLVGPILSSSSSLLATETKASLAYPADNLGSNKYLRKYFGHKPCQGLGFKVLNCELLGHGSESMTAAQEADGKRKKSQKDKIDLDKTEMIIRPNEVKKINIAFSPDFTLTTTSAILTILTDDDDVDTIDDHLYNSAQTNTSIVRKPPMQYTLVANVPENLFAICAPAIPRPYWECILYYTLVIFVFSLIILAVILAFFDGARVLNLTFYPAIMFTKATSILCEKGDEQVENMNLFQAIMDNSIGKEKTSKKNDAKSVKTKKNNGHKNKKASQNSHEESNKENKGATFYESAQSWTRFLKRKFVRRDSSGSDKSSAAGSIKNGLQKDKNRSGSDQQPINNKKKEEKVTIKEKAESTVSTNNITKRKSASKSWFSSLSSSNDSSSQSNLAQQPATLAQPSLPSFPPIFCEDKLKNGLKNLKGKKNKNSSTSNATLSNHNPSQIEATSNNHNNENKPPKNGKQVKKNKSCESLKSGRSNSLETFDTWANETFEKSSAKSSQIWDSPITMFDTEKAMSELVKQTEAFAHRKHGTNNGKRFNVDSAYDNVCNKSGLCSFGSYSKALTKNPHLSHADLTGTKIWQSSDSPSLWSSVAAAPVSSHKSNASPIYGESAALTPPPQTCSPLPPSLDKSTIGGQLYSSTLLKNSLDNVSNIPVNAPSSWLTDALLDEQLSLQSDCGPLSSWPTNPPLNETDDLDPFATNNHGNNILQHSRLKEWTRSSQFESINGGEREMWGYPETREDKWSLAPSSSPILAGSPPPPSSSATTAPVPISTNPLINSSHVWENDGRKPLGSIWNNDSWSQFVAPKSALTNGVGPSEVKDETNSFDNNPNGPSNFSLFGRSPWSPINPTDPLKCETPDSMVSSLSSLADVSASSSSSLPKVSPPSSNLSPSWSHSLFDYPPLSRSPGVCINGEKRKTPKNKK